MGKVSRDSIQLFGIYGMDEMHAFVLSLLQGSVLGCVAVLVGLYFREICVFLADSMHFMPVQMWKLAVSVAGVLIAVVSMCYYFTAYNTWYSSIDLHWKTALRMVSIVENWSNVRTALDVGCGRGILLNAVATQMKKEGSDGRVVGMDVWQGLDGQVTVASTLRTAAIEGVQKYVTCRSGDPRNIPFNDNLFEVVVSALFLHSVGKGSGSPKSPAAAAQRTKALYEIVRVLKPGGIAVIWDVNHVPEYVQRLHELKMEDVRVSKKFSAYMLPSQIVSFRKPYYCSLHLHNQDWRSDIR